MAWHHRHVGHVLGQEESFWVQTNTTCVTCSGLGGDTLVVTLVVQEASQAPGNLRTVLGLFLGCFGGSFLGVGWFVIGVGWCGWVGLGWVFGLTS